MVKLNSKIYYIIVLFLGSCLVSCKQTKENGGSKKDTVKLKKTTKKIEKLPYYNAPDFTPTWLPSDDDLKEFHKIPDFNFKSQLGNEITNNTLKGYIYVAGFFFTSCSSICIDLTKNMHTLQEIYSDDDEIKLISHSVYPKVDTVEVLKEYGDRHNIDPQKWYLVTGKKEKIYELAREAYFADDVFKETNDKSRFVHTENLILIDKKGHIRGVYKGTLPLEMKRIQRHIKILKKE